MGDVPTVEEMVGTPSTTGGTKDNAEDDQKIAKLARTEISLTLTNKFEVPDDDDSDMKALFVRYVFLVRLIKPNQLIQIFELPA